MMRCLIFRELVIRFCFNNLMCVLCMYQALLIIFKTYRLNNPIIIYFFIIIIVIILPGYCSAVNPSRNHVRCSVNLTCLPQSFVVQHHMFLISLP